MNDRVIRRIAIAAIILAILTIIMTISWALAPESRGEPKPAESHYVFCFERAGINGCGEKGVKLAPSEYCYNKDLWEIPNNADIRYCK